MKLTATARRLYAHWTDPALCAPMLAQLAQYAAQRPGFDPADYGCAPGQYATADEVRAFRSDYRKATRQLAQVRAAIRAAAYTVTDADLIEASRGDRLTITPQGIDYTTGQYFPLEYRPAVARVIERATRAAAQRTAKATP
jgi:hypothetical protein